MPFESWDDQPGTEVLPGDVVWGATGQQLQVIRAHILPGTDFGLHQHDEEQIICVLEGTLEFTVGEETRLVRPGGVILAPAGVPHGGRVASEDPVVTLEAFTPPRVDFSAPHAGGLDFENPQ